MAPAALPAPARRRGARRATAPRPAPSSERGPIPRRRARGSRRGARFRAEPRAAATRSSRRRAGRAGRLPPASALARRKRAKGHADRAAPAPRRPCARPRRRGAAATAAETAPRRSSARRSGSRGLGSAPAMAAKSAPPFDVRVPTTFSRAISFGARPVGPQGLHDGRETPERAGTLAVEPCAGACEREVLTGKGRPCEVGPTRQIAWPRATPRRRPQAPPGPSSPHMTPPCGDRRRWRKPPATPARGPPAPCRRRRRTHRTWVQP